MAQRQADKTASPDSKSRFTRSLGFCKPSIHDAKATDPPLLKKHSEIKSFTTSRFTYPALRVFYRRHPQTDQLPNTPAPLPLLVFVHGLGGSVAQFNALLCSLINVASCLAVDLPGCGVSQFAPTSWDAYSMDALAELLETVIDSYRDKEGGQGVVLIGHSMGAALAARLASKSSAHSTDLSDYVLGLVAICPPSQPPPEQTVALFRKLLWIPTPIFNLWRAWDRRGGPESGSVKRFVGEDADIESKEMQERFNSQSKTPVWRRMAWGSLPEYRNGVPIGGLPGKEVWSSLHIPVFLIGGENDNVTPPKEVAKIVEFLDSSKSASDTDSSTQPVVDAAAPVDTTVDAGRRPGTIDDITDEDFKRDKVPLTDEAQDDPQTPSTPQEQPTGGIPPQPVHPAKIVKHIILPPPATHALLYTPTTSHILAGLISDFLTTHITGRLSLGWQLQYLSREGKWDVKNLAKWKNVQPVSDPIAGVFRAMKTMREVDETHSPTQFVKDWGTTVKDIIDISHDNPVYDPRGLEKAGVRYHKFPTVSKIPPTDQEVDGFIALVDRVREEQKQRAAEEGWGDDYVVGVHCHYGFNRTGYFIVCYLVERCGFGVQEAIDAFAKARPNGIRHSHFLDSLFVRYSGLKQKR
ncbi:mRNA-capping enzyme [Pleurostoma richardsiae]|uniref:mRNA-capping enzyme n=1 Tax=Pleurostoma richardsiae TaxID=41990 RepID=A0AA38RFG9_9PEZI|nr:mRNA-capping enzyme [Pleurostoma richardsiae]